MTLVGGGGGGVQRKDGNMALMIKADFPCPPSCPPLSSSLPFNSGCGRHNAKSSLHLRTGPEATAERDGGRNLPLADC